MEQRNIISEWSNEFLTYMLNLNNGSHTYISVMKQKWRKEQRVLMMHSTNFIYNYAMINRSDNPSHDEWMDYSLQSQNNFHISAKGTHV